MLLSPDRFIASCLAAPSPKAADSLPALLSARQAPAAFNASLIPSQCQPSCTVIEGAYSACNNATCLCTLTNSQGLQSCMDCFLSSTGDVTDAQTIVTEFNHCLSNGYPIASVTLAANATSTSAVPSSTPALVSTTSFSATPTTTRSSSTGGAVGGRVVGLGGVVGVWGVGFVSAVAVLIL